MTLFLTGPDIQRVAKQIGITVPVTFQVLRRSFVTRHRNQLKDAGAVVGHSNYATPPPMTMRSRSRRP